MKKIVFKLSLRNIFNINFPTNFYLKFFSIHREIILNIMIKSLKINFKIKIKFFINKFKNSNLILI
jgi:hypothetical protein